MALTAGAKPTDNRPGRKESFKEEGMNRYVAFALALGLGAALLTGATAREDEEDIRSVILSAYRDGLINVGDVEAVRKGFHPEFRLLGLKDGALTILPIAEWIAGTEAKKAAGKFPPPQLAAFEIPLIDICGDAAVVKVKFFIGEKLTFTDYLSLYRFAEGWKIVAKIYARH
jgi:hypothetical protein